MRTLMHVWIVCAGVACAGLAIAAPKPAAPKPAAPTTPKVDARSKYQEAVKLSDQGEPEKALAAIEEGLALAPQDRPLLALQRTVLLNLRDYAGALAAYQAYVDTGLKGATLRAAMKIIGDLEAVKSTSLDITLASGAAPIYLDTKTQGVFCTAAPSCNKALLPGDYKVIVERAGFERWTGRVTVERGKTATVAVTLVEKPSVLTVRVAQPGARVTVDDAVYEAPAKVAAGPHRVVVSLAGHAEARLEAAAHEGKPVELDVALTPLVAVHVEPAEAQVLLDDKPVAVVDGHLGLPPGAHALIARAAGFVERHIEIPAERAPEYTIEVKLEVKLEVNVARAASPPASPSRFTGRRKIGLAVGGVGLVAVSAGIVLGVQSSQLDKDAYALCPSATTPCADAREATDLNVRARSRALQANVAYGIAGGAAIAAAVLWFTGAPESRVAITPQLGAVAGLDVSVRF
jgi:hypothetical protein